VRYLLVGLGNLGQKRLAVLGDRCVATVDPYNPAATFADPDACPPDRYDCAILAVPNETKLPLLRAFLGRGKHVLVEKPLLFACRDEAERLDQLARDHNAIWYTSYNHRLEPLVVRLKHHLDHGAIGRLYHGRLFYGNGTARNILGTWREQGRGVLEDLGSHLLDLADYLLGYGGRPFVAWSLGRNELATFDHVVLAAEDRRLVLEASYLCWKNTFSVDLYGERGSIHLNGLVKWGPSELVVRKRVLPSGRPEETVERQPAGNDPTWERDLEHFESLCVAGRSSVENDAWISSVLDAVA
jgi:scyllo-inositol 2-dehydrogenase (NADP+)